MKAEVRGRISYVPREHRTPLGFRRNVSVPRHESGISTSGQLHLSTVSNGKYFRVVVENQGTEGGTQREGLRLPAYIEGFLILSHPPACRRK